MPYYRPVFVSERENAHLWPDGRSDDSRWEDCAPTSLVMLASACSGRRTTATLAEAEALRAAAGYGPLGGTNLATLAPVASKRYSLSISLVSGFDALWLALAPGKGAAIAGKFTGLPYGHPLRRFQPDFTGDHAVYVQREDTQDRVWWMDPLGPKDGTYSGQWVSKADLRAFLAAGWNFGAVSTLARIPTATSYSIVIAPYTTVRLATVNSNGLIAGWTTQKWGANQSSAPCKEPVTKAGFYSGSAKVAFVTAGVFKNRWVGIGNGVSVTTSKG